MSQFLVLSKFKDYFFALVLTQPRILALCTMVPIFSQQLLPGRLRSVVVMVLGIFAVPVLLPRMASFDIDFLTFMALMLKEVFIGLVLGFFIAMPFWLFEAVGGYIDYQRGASMGAVFNPAMGAEATSMAILLQLVYGVFFLTGAGLPLMLALLYESFRLWDVLQWMPTLHREAMPLLLSQMDKWMELVLLLSAPVVVVMLLAELGLALASRFTPQLQVFFLAMPIKSGLAVLILVLYMSTLLHNAGTQTTHMLDLVPFLQKIWGAR